MKLRAALVLSSLIFLSNAALAAEPGNNYFGIALGDAKFKVRTVATSPYTQFSTTSLTLRYGYNVLPFLSLEAHAAMSSREVFSDPEITYGGAFVRLSIPTERTRLYILGGKTIINYDISTTFNNEVEEELAGGIGLELYGSERTALTFEAMRYGETQELDVFSIGFVRRF